MSDPTGITPAGSDEAWDAIVIGAGPSGAMAARELARGGARVLMVDKQAFPREKVCGGCLNGRALGVLESVGLGDLARRAGGVPLGSVRVGVRGRSFRLGLPAGMAVPRDRFDEGLVAAAMASGVTFSSRTEARVESLARETRRVRLGRNSEGRVVEARLVLAATGLGPGCWPADASPRVRLARGSKIGAGCFLADNRGEYERGTIHMAVAKAGYVGLVRLADGRLHVAGAFLPAELHGAGGPGAAAEAILREAGLVPPDGLRTAAWRGTTSLTRRIRPPADTRLFVLGDAAGYVEPFTGEGIAWALASGWAIGPMALRAVERWEPGLAVEWDRLHARVVRRRQVVCRAVAAMLRRPRLFGAVMAALNRVPGPANGLLRHLNTLPHIVEAS